MRVFFCGAPGVGKSTLVQKLAKLYPTYTVHDSMSALFMKEKQEQFTSSTFQNRVNIYCYNIFLNSRDDVIMSRSIIDSLAFNKEKIDREYVVKILPDCVRESDIFIYLPIEFEISEREDGLRETDKSYQSLIDWRIKKIIKDFPSKNVFTITGDVDERLEKIIKIMKNGRVKK